MGILGVIRVYGLGEVVSKCLGVLGYLVWRSSRKKAVYCE